MNTIKTTFRSLLKNKSYGFLNIAGLAVGIACAGLIFLWVADEMTYDGNNVKKDRLYSVQVNAGYGGNIFTMGSTPRIMAATIKSEIPGIVNTCRLSDEGDNTLFNADGKLMYSSGKYADAAVFSMFTLPFIQGNAANAFSQLHAIVLTQKAAGKFFGENHDVIGRTIRIDNKQDYVVTGILKDLPENSTLQFEWLASYDAYLEQHVKIYGRGDLTSWESFGPLTYVELASSANPVAINKKLYNFIYSKDNKEKNTAFLFPMRDWHLYGEFANGKQTGGGQIKQVHFLSLIAWIILFIACINFMNLATARSEKRAREIGVRKVLGARRRKLIVQFIGEALFLSAVAALFAIVIMFFSLPAFNTLVHKNLSLQLNDSVQISGLLIIIMICGFLAGSYPALYLSSFNPVKVLKGLRIKSGSATAIRKGLVVLQFTVSVVFIISTIIIYMQVQQVKSRNIGFNKDNLVEINMQHAIAKDFPVIREDLLRTGVIENAALADHTTISDGNTDDRFTWQGKSPDNKVGIAERAVSPEFISTYGLHIIKGRDFIGSAFSDSSNIIITQSLAKLISKDSPIGQVIQLPDHITRNFTVAGVVNDYTYGDAYHASGPVIFFCRRPLAFDDNLIYVRIKAGHNSQQTLSEIGDVIRRDNPAFPFQYKFVDDQFNEMFANEIQMSKLSTLFAVLAVFISCLGLFSLAAYTAERRIKEIGIRKVLGASVPGIAGLLSKEFLQLVGISCLVAFPSAWWMMHNWLQGDEYRVSIHWWIFALAGVTALFIAVATISFQAIKAALMNPVKSLRSE